jgi:chromosomal replication initiation ATPase DnaA
MLPAILGSEKFLSNIKDRFFTKKSHKEIPESKILVPEKREIMSVISREYSVSLDELKLTRGEHKNEARDVAIYFMRRLRCDILNTLCGELNLKKDSSVGIIVDRVEETD